MSLGWLWALKLLDIQDLQLWQVASYFQMCWVFSQSPGEKLGQELALDACAIGMLRNKGILVELIPS